MNEKSMTEKKNGIKLLFKMLLIIIIPLIVISTASIFSSTSKMRSLSNRLIEQELKTGIY